MHASGTVTGSLPDWYLIERETEKTIEKLNSAKEMVYYTGNSDEYIRRLAILRLKKLGLKESGEILKEIMDDPAESHANKFLAAWALKSLLAGNNDDFFMYNSRFLSGFTGHERYEDLFPVMIENNERDISFRFSSSPCYTAFSICDDDTVLEKEVHFSSDFDARQWLNCVGASLKSNISQLVPRILKIICSVPSVLYASVRKAFGSLPKHKRAPGTIRQKKQKLKTPGYKHNYSDEYSLLRKEIYGRPDLMSRVKKGVFGLFYFLFFPIRLARRHKAAFFFILLSIYAFFTYFSYGRAITSKYAGFDMQEVQSRFFASARNLYSQAVNEINRITGIDEWKKEAPSPGRTYGEMLKTSDVGIPGPDAREEDDEIYIVTAKDGLNIRTAPDPSSPKVGTAALPYLTRVTFISSALHGASGVEWFYVEAEDGRIGWVSSKYLRLDKEQ